MAASYLKEAWLRYRDWLEKTAPDVHELLLPPASRATLRLVESNIGQMLPYDVAELWSINNGQRGETPGVAAGFVFLSAEAAIEQWRKWADLRYQLRASQQAALVLPGQLSEAPEACSTYGVG
jgi:cell wall assembly regulator SMI1